ncbi:MAG: hypothetical protein HFJ52_03080 [Clostridia bacterium]|nr:hypothetical protein [Clostridia bacterium]
MNYINRLEVENKGLEVVNKELKKEVSDLKIYLAMARGTRDYNEKMLFAEQKEKNKLQGKLTEAEKQIKILQKAVDTLTKENKRLKEEVKQNSKQSTNTELQELIANGLNFLTQAMMYNASKLKRN